MAPVDCAGFAAALGERDAASVPVCVGRCDVGAAMIEPDLACEPAEADDPVAACLARRVAGVGPGRSAAPVPPSLPGPEVRLDADREVDAPLAEGADD